MKLITHFLLLFAALVSTFASPFPENDFEKDIKPKLLTDFLEDTHFMAKINASNEYCIAVIITKRFLLTGASFLKRHNTNKMFVNTATKMYKIKDIFLYSTNSSLGLIQLKEDIVFDIVTRPIALLMKNELNLHLYTEFRTGKELLVVGYTNYINEENKTNIEESFDVFCETTVISEFTKETIQTDYKNTTFNNGACLIVNEKLAGLSDCGLSNNGTFSGIPYYFSWISHIVGFENLREAFFHKRA